MTTPFNGLGLHLGNLSRLSSAKTRSISPENRTGEKGGGGRAEPVRKGDGTQAGDTWSGGTGAAAARDLGTGWKVSPSLRVDPGTTLTLADIEGPGAIQQIWLTPTGVWRYSILRIYWDDQEHPSVECPVGDFFACGWNRYAQVSSLAVCVNPGSAFNCYWEMPFRQRCRVTLENIGPEPMTVYYQINYTLTDVPDDAAYFHAQFRRANPLGYKQVYPILDGVAGRGHYVGTYMAWQVNNTGWWGEGEIKFYLDGDAKEGQPVAEETDDKSAAAYPTICGTGTEDYFCGSYNFDVGGQFREFTTPYAGLPQVIRPDGSYQSQTRFGMYRWHITDPIRFEQDLKVTIQALSWRSGGRYLPLQDDIASVAYWYQTLPTAPFPQLPDRDGLEII